MHIWCKGRFGCDAMQIFAADCAGIIGGLFGVVILWVPFVLFGFCSMGRRGIFIVLTFQLYIMRLLFYLSICVLVFIFSTSCGSSRKAHATGGDAVNNCNRKIIFYMTSAKRATEGVESVETWWTIDGVQKTMVLDMRTNKDVMKMDMQIASVESCNYSADMQNGEASYKVIMHLPPGAAANGLMNVRIESGQVMIRITEDSGERTEFYGTKWTFAEDVK